MAQVFRSLVYPKNTWITRDLDRVDYFDSFRVRKPAGDSIDKIVQRVFGPSRWVDYLMTARNYLIAKPFGLKTAEKEAQSGKMPSKNIFPVLFRNENEIVMGANDKHLSFRASVLLAKAGDETDVFLTTVVRFNNFGGRLYFALIKPFHRLIVKSALRKL